MVTGEGEGGGAGKRMKERVEERVNGCRAEKRVIGKSGEGEGERR